MPEQNCTPRSRVNVTSFPEHQLPERPPGPRGGPGARDPVPLPSPVQTVVELCRLVPEAERHVCSSGRWRPAAACRQGRRKALGGRVSPTWLQFNPLSLMGALYVCSVLERADDRTTGTPAAGTVLTHSHATRHVSPRGVLCVPTRWGSGTRLGAHRLHPQSPPPAWYVVHLLSEKCPGG